MAELASFPPVDQADTSRARPFDEVEYRLSAAFGYAWVAACGVGLVMLFV